MEMDLSYTAEVLYYHSHHRKINPTAVGFHSIARDHKTYRVAQNKPDYLLLLSKFCISTTKHVSMIMYM